MLESILSSPFAIAALIAWTIVAVVGTYAIAARFPLVAGQADSDVVRRVFKNSAIPIASQMLIRVMDLAVAVVLLRLLGPEGNGQYAIAVIVWLYVKTISDFGLSLLATRDIARDRSVAGSVVGKTTLMRLLVLGITGVPVAAYVGAGLLVGNLAAASVLAIGLLYLSIVPSSFSDAVNSALNGVERMDVAAWLNIGVNLVRAPLVVLLAATQLEVVGVALAALVTAALSADLFRRAFRGLVGQPVSWSLPRGEARSMARESWPLLVNALLVNLFFRIDVFLVQAFRGDVALGIYDAAYKLINLVTIIPAYVTLAIFPTLSARARNPAMLERTQRTASYLLVWIAWGIVVGVTALAETAIRVLAGSAYLPEAALLLRILIWFAPLSFLNGVIQYVLVAADEQRRVVPVFVAAVVFNLLANLAFIPVYGARAAAVNTVVTEIVILGAFAVVTRRSTIGAPRSSAIERLWRPTAAGLIGAMAAGTLASRVDEGIACLAGVLLFAASSLVLGVVGTDERELFRRAFRRSTAARA